MIKEVRWKFVIVAVILAMSVSLLSGGLNGIRLGVLITRAMVGGLVFAALAVLVNMFAVRFFPELFDSDGDFGTEPADDEAADGGDRPGSRVDIVMPAEGPELADPADGSASGIDGDEPSDVIPAGLDSEEEVLPGEQGVETMGDLDRFSSDFSDVDDDGDKATKGRADGPMSDQDPEEIAQAIHTVLSRDKKG